MPGAFLKLLPPFFCLAIFWFFDYRTHNLGYVSGFYANHATTAAAAAAAAAGDTAIKSQRNIRRRLSTAVRQYAKQRQRQNDTYSLTNNFYLI